MNEQELQLLFQFCQQRGLNYERMLENEQLMNFIEVLKDEILGKQE